MKKFVVFVSFIYVFFLVAAGTASAAPSNEEILRIIRSDDVGALSLALSKGLDVSARIDESSGMSLLHFAILSNSSGIIRELLRAGADIEADSAAGTPLYAALMFSVNELNDSRRESKGKIVDLLLEAGADVNVLNEWGDSPLNVASSGRNVGFCLEMARKLIDRGAKVNSKNDFSLTPLHEAFAVFVVEDLDTSPHPDTLESRAPLVAFLITSGADVNAVSVDGETPIFLALKDVESMKLLLDAGAKVDIRNKKDETPFDVAMKEGNDAAIKLLLSQIGN